MNEKMTVPAERPTVPILGIPISTLGMDSALALCATQAERKQGGYVCFANVHTVTESQSNPLLRNALARAFLSVADGLPLVWVSRWLKNRPIESRVCGPDFMRIFLERYRGIRSGFIGGSPGLAEKLATRFELDAPCVSPPMRPFSPESAWEDWQELVRKNGSKPLPQVVWVGLGAPKQELWMQSLSAAVPGVVFLGVGAAFDFLTNAKKRAPAWMQRTGLEWFYRLIQEPRRLAKRYFSTNLSFIFFVLADWLGIKKTRA
jgi:N-acetylglucosaminyldiphosphoundecaprenol N-acetyl-beta-D-mannosaminyltransferase